MKIRTNPHTFFGAAGALVLTIALALYVVAEPQRLEEAEATAWAEHVAAGRLVYAENCVVCHDADGSGIGATPSLAAEGLKTMDFDALYDVIARGRYGTSMPAWSATQGGPLRDDALNALVVMIQDGEWRTTATIVAQQGLLPRQPVSVEVPTELLLALGSTPGGEAMTRAIQIYAANCVACHGSNGEGTTLAPALNDEDLRSYRTSDQLVHVITHGVPGTLMAGWTKILSDGDVDALAALILDWDSLDIPPLPDIAPQPSVTSQEQLDQGEALYAQNCASCHGSSGQGTQRAPALNVQSFFERSVPEATEQIIAMGVPGTAMPSWGDRLSSEEVAALAAFIHAWEPTAPAVAVPERRGQGPPWMRGGTPAEPAPAAPSRGNGAGRGGGPPWRTSP